MRRGEAEPDRPSHSADGLFFIFEKDARPDRSKVIAALRANPGVSVSHDPFGDDIPHRQSADAECPQRRGDWMELLHWGMTFDCLGLAPGPPVAAPDVVHRFSLPADLEIPPLGALALVPGPHLADAASSLPVVRSMLDVAITLSENLEGVAAICWSPAKSAIAPEFFNRAVRSWIEGGPFPALGLVGLRITSDDKMATDGLHWFIEQEVVLGRALSADKVAATRLIVRLVHELVAGGPVQADTDIQTDDGQHLRLKPTADRYIEVDVI